MNKLKVAVFGCGKMGIHHLRAIRLQKYAEIIAVADPQADREKLGGILPTEAKVFSSPEELLRTVRPDVVHISTPPASHSELTKLALKYGANVYVEKPFASNANEAKSMISLADEMKRKISAGHQLLFEEPARHAAASLGTIGRLIHVESYFSFHTVRRSPDGRSVLSPVEQLLDILPHPVYVLLDFLHKSMDQSWRQTVQLLSLDVKPMGDVHALLRIGEVTGVLVVTLRGRPIESYLRLVGTNGSLYVDFAHGALTKLSGPGTSGVSRMLNPYSQAKQNVAGVTHALAARILKRQKGYPGLSELIGAFYESIIKNTPSPLPTQSISETVSLCEVIGKKLKEAEAESEKRAEVALREVEMKLPPPTKRGGVLVTGGTGFLGRAIVTNLRNNGWPVRAISRRIPPPSARVPGVEYTAADLGERVPNKVFDCVVTVVHCAAETAGGKEAHVRNTIDATRNILEAAARAGVKRFIHISSIAVLKTTREVGGPLDENTPIDMDNIGRGSYVWGKATSEHLASQLGRELGMSMRIIRPGALVDFDAFEAPGRLGREVGPLFIAVGDRRSRLSICNVQTVAQVVAAYLREFDSAPMVVNLIEPEAPTRGDLASHLLKRRPDLKIVWIPGAVFWTLSFTLKGLQRLVLRGQKPIDLWSTFSSEMYDNSLIVKFLQDAAELNKPQSRIEGSSSSRTQRYGGEVTR